MSNIDDGPGGSGDVPIDVDAVLTDPAEQREDPHDETTNPSNVGGGGGGGGGPTDQPLAASCLRTFDAVHTSGTRPLSSIRLIVLHSTEGETASGAATWWANPASGGSGHLIVDDHQCFRALDNEVIPWGAPGANKNGFHIEHAGFARWSRAEWLEHEDTLRRGAFKVALHARKFNIPLTVLSASELRAGRSGIVTHNTVSQVFNGDHTDPGPNFPLDHYMELVRGFAADA